MFSQGDAVGNGFGTEQLLDCCKEGMHRELCLCLHLRTPGRGTTLF